MPAPHTKFPTLPPLASLKTVEMVVDIARYPLIRGHPGFDPPISRPLADIEAILKMQQFAIMPMIVLESDCVAISPKSSADCMTRRLALKTSDLPGDARLIPTAVVWSPVSETDSAQRWFRDLISTILKHQIRL